MSVDGQIGEVHAWLSKALVKSQNLAPFLELFKEVPRTEIRRVLTKIDRWSNRRIAPLINKNFQSPLVLLSNIASRDPITGLRHFSYKPRLSLQAASEDELRQVPGIGSSTAKAIVEARHLSSIVSLRHLLDLGVLSKESFVLAAPFFEDVERDSQFADFARPNGFRGLIFLIGAMTPGKDFEELALNELRTGFKEVFGASQFGTKRRPGDPVRLYRDVLLNGDVKGVTPVSLLNSREYIRIVHRLLQKAESRAWLQAPSFNVMHVTALSPLLSALVETERRGVDVRVMFDSRYFPVANGDDVAFLQAQGISCRPFPLNSRLHARTLVVDGEHILCGSNSWSATSAFYSEELSIYVRSEPIGLELGSRFECLWNASNVISDQPLSGKALSDLLDFERVNKDRTHVESRVSNDCNDAGNLPWVEIADLMGSERIPFFAASTLARAGVKPSSALEFLKNCNNTIVKDRKGRPDSEFDLTPLNSVMNFLESLRLDSGATGDNDH